MVRINVTFSSSLHVYHFELIKSKSTWLTNVYCNIVLYRGNVSKLDLSIRSVGRGGNVVL